MSGSPTNDLASFRLDLPLGRCVGVPVPARLDPTLLRVLHPAERAFLSTLGPARQPLFLAGRLALRAALVDVGLASEQPLLPDDRGAPRMPPGVLGSVSHKGSLAVALVAPDEPNGDRGLGVDLEEDRPLRIDIAPRVLTPDERAALDGLATAERHRRTLIRFSAKEALYKAVSRWRPRLSFQQATVSDPMAEGALGITLLLPDHGDRIALEGLWRGQSGHLITAVMALRIIRQ